MDLQKIKQLIDLLHENNLNEIEVKTGDASVKIRKEIRCNTAPAISAILPTSTTSPQTQTPSPILSGHIERSPMVGTVYLAKTPGAKPFVAVGQSIKSGDTFCMIEAMKVFSPIKASQNGIIGACLVQDGQAVEYNDPLFTITQS